MKDTEEDEAKQKEDLLELLRNQINEADSLMADYKKYKETLDQSKDTEKK